MPADKPTELLRIKLKKTWTRQPVPMISKHSAHLTPLPFGIRTWLWRYTYLSLFISMLWHRQAIFESKGDKLSSSAECRIRTQRVSETQSSADYMHADKPTELSRIKLKNLNSTARPYDQQAFSPPDPTAIWHSHLSLAIYIFVVVIFDALAEASDFRIKRRQVVFLCWMQDSNPESLSNPIFSRLNACWHTDWAIEDQAKKNLNSTARPYDQQAFSPPDPTAIWYSHLALAIYIFVVVNFDALAQASDYRIKGRQFVFLCWMQDSNPEGLWNPIFSRLYARWKNDWAIKDQAKKLELDSPSLWSASIQPTWPHCHLAFAPGSGHIHICCCSFRCFGTGKRFSNQKETSCLPLLNAGFEPRGSLQSNLQQTECLLTNRLSYWGSS